MKDKRIKKTVRWSTITVYEFGVGMGGSAVPKRGGPSIGLARKPKRVWSTTVEDASLHDTLQPIVKESTCNDDPVQDRRKRRRVRWFKPLERVSMLEKAGISQDKIYQMLMECSNIAMSRRLCQRLLLDST